MKEGKSKVVKRTPSGRPYESDKGTFYSFNVELEDGTKGLFRSSKEDPNAFREGVECEYIQSDEPKKSGDGTWSKLTPKKEPFVKGGGFKQKPTNVFTLELSRKMFNSSQETEERWTIDKMLSMADWLKGEIDKGVERDAIETATTIQCANAVHGANIDTKGMLSHIKLISSWLKK